MGNDEVEEDPLNSFFEKCDSLEQAQQENNEGTFKCHICSVSYKHKKSLTRHLRLHDAVYMCKKCSIVFSSAEELERHNEKHAYPQHLCSVCGKKYKKKSSLTEHSLKHGGISLKCPVKGCNKEFTRAKRMADHLNSHTDLKPYTCEICKKKYKSHTSLQIHSSTCLLGVKCPECGKTFSSKSVLSDHLNSTHASKKFICTCGKSFKWRSSLSRHKDTKGCQMNRH